MGKLSCQQSHEPGILPTALDEENEAEKVKWLAQCHPLIREGGDSDAGCFQGPPPSKLLNEGFSFTLLSP